MSALVVRDAIARALHYPAIFLKPFSPQSLWNARPVNPVLGNYQIPNSSYEPTMTAGAFSCTAFFARPSDPALTVFGNGANGAPAGMLDIQDAETYAASVSIAHCPVIAQPASGSDGHIDVYDLAANRIHSFWEFVRNASNGVCTAATYASMAMDGLGFGTPGQYQQGARAAGVPPTAGMIRANEIDDGQPMFMHALCVSLDFTGLSANPTFVFPATSSDGNASSTNSGGIPEGARLFLPPTFSEAGITNPYILKLVKTLKVFGCYAVDRNSGTPIVFYVENRPAGFDVYLGTYYNATYSSQLIAIQQALRMMTGNSGWLDGNGIAFTPATWLELLSMRGPWHATNSATALGTFDTIGQQLVFPANGIFTQQAATNGRSALFNAYSVPVAGQSYQFKVAATGGAQMGMQVVQGSNPIYDSGLQSAGFSATFTWPNNGQTVWPYAQSAPGGGGTVQGSLIRTA